MGVGLVDSTYDGEPVGVHGTWNADDAVSVKASDEWLWLLAGPHDGKE